MSLVAVIVLCAAALALLTGVMWLGHAVTERRHAYGKTDWLHHEETVAGSTPTELLRNIHGRRVTYGPLSRELPDGTTQYYAYVRK